MPYLVACVVGTERLGLAMFLVGDESEWTTAPRNEVAAHHELPASDSRWPVLARTERPVRYHRPSDR